MMSPPGWFDAFFWTCVAVAMFCALLWFIDWLAGR